MCLRALLVSLLLFSANLVSAQGFVHDGEPYDSTVISLSVNANDSFIHLNPDTLGSHCWQIGYTNKAFFADSGTIRAVMTDTVNSYSVGLKDWFIIDLRQTCPDGIGNTIIDFHHKYQTTAGKDGGIVEFSNDSGITWQNVAGDCNVDQGWAFFGLLTENCYNKFDTLENGTPAFSGSSNGWQYSRVQFFWFMPKKGTQDCDLSDVTLVRFRFVSDSIPEAMDGWIIDNIKIEQDMWEGGVAKPGGYHSLDVHPNPCSDGKFSFPRLSKQEGFRLAITSALGANVYIGHYMNTLDLGKLPGGLYYYQVSDGTEKYSGKLLIE